MTVPKSMLVICLSLLGGSAAMPGRSKARPCRIHRSRPKRDAAPMLRIA